MQKLERGLKRKQIKKDLICFAEQIRAISYISTFILQQISFS